VKLWTLGPAASVAVALNLVVAPALAANVVYPATYSGKAVTGGTLELHVSPDGTEVTGLSIAKVPMPPCGTVTGSESGRPVPIVNDSFSNAAGLMHFGGSFLPSRRAEGTLTFHNKTTGCESEAVSWTATAPLPPAEEEPSLPPVSLPPPTPPAPSPPSAPPPPPDETPPGTKIESGPSGTTHKETATYRFSATETSSFRCKLDDRAWYSCTSAQVFRGLGDGRHTFEVKATDAAGNVDPTPARRIWHVKHAESNKG
jgi:hypothetical protein